MELTGITDLLGKPYYSTDTCIIYNMDCIEGMNMLPAGSIDLTVTSPPYNIGKEYERPLELADYLEWSREWMTRVYRLTTESGAFWLNLGYVEVAERGKNVPLPYMMWNLTDFYMVQEVVWHYGAGVAGRRMLSPRNEKFLWYAKNRDTYVFNLDDIRDPNVKYPNQKKNGKLKCNPLGKNPTDVWDFPKVTSGTNRSSKERTPHPAQFPLAVIDRIIKASSNVGDLVLDPFMGSGTSAVAALSNGRKVIGFELNASYCDIAAERVEDYLYKKATEAAQLQLFTE